MKNTAVFTKLLLALLIPLTAFAQNQGDDLGLGQGATSIVGRTNESRAALAGANGKANYIGLTAKGDVYTASAAADGAGDFGANMGIAPIFVVADAAEALSTTTVIVATAHVARVNDYVEFTAGTAANIGVWRRVSAVATDSITVAQAFPATVAAADAFNIHRPRLDSSIYAEDSVHVSTNLGQLIFGVGNTSLTAFGASGDYIPFATNTAGALYVDVNFSAQSSGGGGNALLKLEDGASSSGEAGVVMLAQVTTVGTAPSSATNGDYVVMKQDIDGRLNVNAFGSNVDSWWSTCSASNTGTSDTAIKAAVASNRIYTTSISCFNTAAVASSFEIKDGSTVLYAGGISNATLAGVAYWEHTFGVPLRGTVNTALNFDMATTATATTCCAAGFISTN